MVIYLSRIETLVLIPASPQTILNWWSTGCSDYESHSVYSACVPANPNSGDAPTIKFSNKLKRGCSRVVRCSEGRRATASINRCRFCKWREYSQSTWPALKWSWAPRGYACWPPRRPTPSARDDGPLPEPWDWCLERESKCRHVEWNGDATH